MTTATQTYDWSTEPAEPVEAKIRRDRWSRYLIPHPDTGEIRPWTRATTVAGTLADRYGLERWAKRNVVLGIGARRDLYTLAASCTAADTDDLNKIVTQAEEAAKGKAGANAGTAMHRLTERLDQGEDLAPADPQMAADLHAYRATMTEAGIRVARSPDTGQPWIERVLVVPEIDVAGTCDRICLAPGWARPRIADLKTGKDVLRYGMVEIALQLAIYARATHWYDPATGQLHPMPAVDLERALVMHLPVGQGVCHLYDVNIEAGWEAVQLALAVRTWRKRKDLAAPHALPAPATPERVLWLRGRVQSIIDAGHGHELAQTWAQHPDIPTLKAGGLTDKQVTVAACWCAEIEASHGMPFGDPDPATGTTPVANETAPPTPPPAPPDDTWADKGRQLLAPLGDDKLARAIAEAAGCADRRITEATYRRLEAVYQQATSPTGVLQAEAGPDGWQVVTAPDAKDRILTMLRTADSALAHAKHHARKLGVTAPRSLVQATRNPLLTALIAEGAHTSSDGKEMKQ